MCSVYFMDVVEVAKWLSVAWDGHCIFIYTCIIYSQGLSGVIYVCSLPDLSVSVITAFISSNGIAVD
jgi:hypothetical protein